MARTGAISLEPEDTGAADFQDTADIIAGLDAVVSVDSAVAHLAASMGKPCHVLLLHRYDWRWRGPDGRSAWYPDAQLHPQATPGDWEGPLTAAMAAIAAAPRAIAAEDRPG
jgi:ADP-heptose:LPS heptosyltransferase